MSHWFGTNQTMRTISFLILRNAVDHKHAYLCLIHSGLFMTPDLIRKTPTRTKIRDLCRHLFIQYVYLFSIVSFRSYFKNWTKQLNYGKFSSAILLLPRNICIFEEYVIMNRFTFEWERKVTDLHGGKNETVDTACLQSKTKTSIRITLIYINCQYLWEKKWKDVHSKAEQMKLFGQVSIQYFCLICTSHNHM